MATSRTTDRTGARRRRASVAVFAIAAAPLAWAAPSGADVAEVRGGAFGQRVSVSVAGGAPVTSGPAPAVTTAPAGGSARDAAPSVAAGSGDAGGPFGGSYLRTGLLTVGSWGTTGRTGSVTTSATAGAVDALGGALTAQRATSSCVADASGADASVAVEGGRLALSANETVDLPASPAPGTTLTATTGSGERFTVVLNEQETVDATLVVNAVRIVLDGPTASGEVVLAQTRCGATTTATTPGSTPAPTTAPSPTTAPPAPAGDAPAGSGATPADAAATATTATATTTTAAAGEPAPPPPAPDRSVGVRAAAGALQELTVAGVTGSAYGAYAKLSLFGGPPGTFGPVGAVTLPAGGSATPVTGTVPAGMAAIGPAQLFQYDGITTRTQGTTGVNGSVTSSVNLVGGTDDPPGPIIVKGLTSSCTATATKVSGSTTITNGIIETKYETAGANRGNAIATEPIPTNPAPNTERTGKLDHIGDTWRAVFNEQIAESDGSLTVNAVHMFMLGPTGVGEMIVGQSRCGVKTAAVETTTTTAAAAAGAAAAGTASQAAATGGSAGSTGTASLSAASAASGDTAASTGSAAGASTGTAARSSTGTAVAGASQSRSGSGGAALAHTGGTGPRLVSLALLGAALALARLRRRPGVEPSSLT